MPDHRYNLGLAFAAIAEAHGARKAMVWPEGQQLTYADLHEHAARIAVRLMDAGVMKGDVVAIVNAKSPLSMCAIIACVSMGVLYTNVDPASPWERVSRILERCAPKLVLSDPGDDAVKTLSEAARVGGYTLFGLEGDHPVDVAHAKARLAEASAEVTGADAAYIMFTSGSTGFPKGAVMTHRNVLNFIAWGRTQYAITPDDVMTGVNPIYFDNSVFDLYVSIFNGATLVPFGTAHVRDPHALVKHVERLGCTIWFSVPSMLVYLQTMRAITPTTWPRMRAIIFGGEGFPKVKLRELFNAFKDRSALHNVYGPTECTCICSSYTITRSDTDDLSELAPLGRLAPDFDFTLGAADNAERSSGELLLGGPQVGAGYYNDPERTAIAFVQDPRQPAYRKIMYRTGDLVQLGADGLLRFKGRVDNQIKHMGYRIELEEVEAAFSALPVVNEVGVVYKTAEPGTPGSILAYVNAIEGVTPEGLATEVSAILPAYMRPRSIFVQHTALPKNSSGKIDRQALKALAS
ncbi:MAG: amino acid adenylation domain-containing protein [Flavobacteriales bacterium]